MASIFTRIINGEIPSYKVAGEMKIFWHFSTSILSRKVNTLVVPKKEIDYIFDLDDETLQEDRSSSPKRWRKRSTG